MSTPESTPDPDNPFRALGRDHASRIQPPRRGRARVAIAATVFLVGIAIAVAGLGAGLLTNQRGWGKLSIGVAAAVCGVAFAIYDYLGPFGPRPSARRDGSPT